jgi:hypothetical protein
LREKVAAEGCRMRGLFLSIGRLPSSDVDVVRATFSRKGRREEEAPF